MAVMRPITPEEEKLIRRVFERSRFFPVIPDDIGTWRVGYSFHDNFSVAILGKSDSHMLFVGVTKRNPRDEMNRMTALQITLARAAHRLCEHEIAHKTLLRLEERLKTAWKPEASD